MIKSALAMLLLFSLSFCSPDTSAVVFEGVARHENGLIAATPQGFTVQRTEHGFAFNEKETLRNPLAFSLSLERKTTATTETGITQSEGGSGGETYRLTDLRNIGTCQLILKAAQQSEIGEPMFVTARAVLERASAENC
jgi:hypothetical protein